MNNIDQREYNAESTVLSILFHHVELLEATNIQTSFFQDKDFREIFSILKKTNKFNTDLFEKEGYTNSLLLVEIHGSFMYKRDYLEQFRYYEEIIIDNYKREQLNKVMIDYTRGLMDYETYKNKQDEIEAIQAVNKKEHPAKQEYIDAITKRKKPISLGRFKNLSRCLSLESDDLVTVSAPPGYGKTSFLLNLFIECLKNNNNYCQYYNLEVNRDQIIKRMIAISAVKTIREVCNYGNSKDAAIEQTIDMLANTDHYINNEPIEWQQLKTDIIIHLKKEKQNIVFIDYLGLISLNDRNYNKSNYDKITYIMKEIRKLCRKYNVLIFMACQCNRDSLKNDKLTMYSLKDSGEVENSSTHVILLYENKDVEVEYKEINKSVKVDVAKNRNSYIHSFDMIFNTEKQYFAE